MKTYWTEVKEEIKDIRSLTGAALMTTLDVILDFFRIAISNLMEISFSFLAVAMAGMMYGPVVGGIVGGVGDIIEFIIRPTGPFFPGFTLNKILMGVIYGLFLYKKEITWKRIALAVLVENFLSTIVLTPIWLNILYGTALFTIPRIIKMVLLYPVNVCLLCILCRLMKTVVLGKKHMGA
ncbi:folate family ECF transporter S component [Chakrabartyella piscis]|uniref:folate family ECF transporter S component n=1 Tax=Chakrabartyella piscis TaxID=2918914 RepID=UPI0029584097|nr:folate family ECF transporter S component [Chakrabartyella piscis]